MGFILHNITPWNHKNERNCYFGGTLGVWEPVYNSMVFMILQIFESFSLYLLVKNNFNFKLSFFTYFEYILGGIIRKNILHSDYHSAWWYWYKKDEKNMQTSYKIFSQCLFVNPSLLWAFMVQNNSFSGGNSRKKGIPVIKSPFLCKKIHRITVLPELTPKLLIILAGLILHCCGV